MKTQEEAEELAQLMVEIGNADGKDTKAVITDMIQPLGCAVGNALEVIEAIEVLKNQGPEDITHLSIYLAAMMIYMSKMADSVDDAIDKAKDVIKSGKALDKFRQLVSGQGGNPDIVENYELLPQASHTVDLIAEKSGYISSIDAMSVGLASQHTGAGRQTKEDIIDLSAGIYLHKKVGSQVNAGDKLATLYGCDEDKLDKALTELAKAITIDRTEVKTPTLIKKVIEGAAK
jgi:pyrimidine-nucleoside phosphorylase